MSTVHIEREYNAELRDDRRVYSVTSAAGGFYVEALADDETVESWLGEPCQCEHNAWGDHVTLLVQDGEGYTMDSISSVCAHEPAWIETAILTYFVSVTGEQVTA